MPTGWERERRVHFDEIVETYDRIRPQYPDELFSDILSFSGGRGAALEIGAGTGIATAPFISAGFDVTAVELGANMAAFLQKRYSGINVITAAFEDAELHNDSYDLVYAASAFHWVDAEVGCPKVYRLLKDGGTFALFRYNALTNDGDALYEEMQELYRLHEHENYKRPHKTSKDDFYKSSEIYRSFRFEDMSRYGFRNVTMKFYNVSRTFSSDDYLQMLDTFSDIRCLPDADRTALKAGIKEAIIRHGDRLKVDYLFQLYMGRK